MICNSYITLKKIENIDQGLKGRCKFPCITLLFQDLLCYSKNPVKMSTFRLANLTLIDLVELVGKRMDDDHSVALSGVWFDVYGLYDMVAELKITVMSDKNLLLTHTPVLSHTRDQMKVSELLAFLTEFLRENPQYSTYYMWREVFEMPEPLTDFEVYPGETFEAIIR